MKRLNTGIYIRVSTEEQIKGYSINAQKEKLTNYSSIKDWNVYKIYIDEGKSGKDLNRPQIQLMIKDIEKKNINNVLVFKIDRLTRSTKDLIFLIDYFKKYNCDFNSLTEAIDTSTPTGRMFIKIIGLFAEFERETIAERIKLGLERKVKEGYSICSSTASYGYKKIKGKNVQIIDEIESKIVKIIYSMYINGKKIEDIKKYLIKNKIKTKKNKIWNNKTIKNILMNPNYIGNVRYGINKSYYFERKGKHKAIVTIDEFLKVKELLNNESNVKKDAYYSKKLICLCKKKMCIKRIYVKNKCYINYMCTNKDCNIKMISHKKLDKCLNINKLQLNNKIEYVYNNIYIMAIVSQKKEILIVYNNVNKNNNKFTLVKK